MTVSFTRPFLLLRLSIRRPPFVLIRARKPKLRLLLVLLGWYVRFIVFRYPSVVSPTRNFQPVVVKKNILPETPKMLTVQYYTDFQSMMSTVIHIGLDRGLRSVCTFFLDAFEKKSFQMSFQLIRAHNGNDPIYFSHLLFACPPGLFLRFCIGRSCFLIGQINLDF